MLMEYGRLFCLIIISSEFVRPMLFYTFGGCIRDYFGMGVLLIFLGALALGEEDFALVTAVVSFVWGCVNVLFQFLPIPRHSPLFATQASIDFIDGKLHMVGSAKMAAIEKKAAKKSSKKGASKGKPAPVKKASKKSSTSASKKASKKTSKKTSKKAKQPVPSTASLTTVSDSDSDSDEYSS
mgnify:CR=1 FL=1